MRRQRSVLVLLLALALGLSLAAPSPAADRRVAQLAPKYRQWLEDAALLLRKDEKAAFLDLKENYQRDGFIAKFWAARDPDPETPKNEFKEIWYARLEEVRKTYGSATEDRSRMFLFHGPADRTWRTDCQLALWPLEIWYYARAERLPGGFYVIFYQRQGGGPYRLWIPADGTATLQATGGLPTQELGNRPGQASNVDGLTDFERLLENSCSLKVVLTAFRAVQEESQVGNLTFTEIPPPPRDTEWLATFLSFSTDLPKEPAKPAARRETGPPRKASQLAPKYRQWLEEVALLLRKEEREAFLSLKEDYQRDGFIEKFWAARDPYPETPRNEFKEMWYARLQEAREAYGSIAEDRARMLLLHGAASQTWKTDCQLLLWPIEIWYYVKSERLPGGFFAIFYQRGGGGPFRLWNPAEGTDILLAQKPDEGTKPPIRENNVNDKGNGARELAQAQIDSQSTPFERLLDRYCSDKAVARAFQAVQQESQIGSLVFTQYPPAPRDTEWLATFLGLSTDLSQEAPKLTAQLTVGFPEPRGDRTLVQVLLQIPRDALTRSEVQGQAAYNLLVTGEVLKDDALHESFRYRFDLPIPSGAPGDAAAVPLVFERTLRPGDYTLVVRLDDLTGKRSFREARPITVPKLAAKAADPAVTASLGEAREELSREDATVKLVPPPGETATGPVRIEAKVSGEAIRKVTFALDGKPLLTKANPPYSVDLSLGTLPTPHTVRAVGLDAAGKEVAFDELLLNGAPQRFAVRLLSPRRGERHGKPGERLPARAEVQVPDGQTLSRLELYLDERLLATLYQPPFSLPVTLPSPPPRYLRAVAYLADGSTAEDLVLLNAPGYQENVDVPLVEVYAAVKDAQGRPVLDLKQGDFKILDGGSPQEIVRFERVTDLPVSTALLIDTSASMVKSLPEAQRAALEFLQTTLSPRDRAALIPFNESPRLAVKLSNDLPTLGGALAGLQAERGTVLWDSLVFGLHYLQGVKGQRALLLLTDGGDRSSHFSFDEALEYARRSGVTLYTVGLAVSKLDIETRKRLSRLAEETGGRSFFPDAAGDLSGIYRQIQEELRSRYLLVYQPAAPGKPGEYRPVTVQVARPGVTVEAIRGYYP